MDKADKSEVGKASQAEIPRQRGEMVCMRCRHIDKKAMRLLHKFRSKDRKHIYGMFQCPNCGKRVIREYLE